MKISSIYNLSSYPKHRNNNEHEVSSLQEVAAIRSNDKISSNCGTCPVLRYGVANAPRNDAGYLSIPKKSRVSFGWCDIHQTVSSEYSEIFGQKMEEMRKAIELKKKQDELYKLDKQANEDAVKFLLNFINKQKGVAEFIPLWTILQNVELQKSMDENPIFGDPAQCLIAMTNIEKFKISNPKYSPEMNEQAAGSLQLHATAILIEQIERNKHKMAPENAQRAEELVKLGIAAVDNAFGKGTYEQLLKLSQMGNALFEHQGESMALLNNIDARAKRFSFGDEFNEKLHDLMHEIGNVHGHDHEHHHEHEEHEITVQYHTHEGNPLHNHNDHHN